MAIGTSALLASAMVVQAAGTAATSYAQSKAQKSEGDYQKQIYESNARLADIQADDAIRRGEKDAKQHKKNVKRLIGSQRAALAAQGLDLEADDALAIQQESAEYGALDVLEIKNNAWREAWGYKVQANDFMGRARFADITAKNKARNTILTGGMSIASDAAYGAYLSKAGVPRYKEV